MPLPRIRATLSMRRRMLPNKLTHKSRSSKENLAIFSEIFFPWGWTATIDGKEVPIGRADYVLRALRIPSGEHEIIFSFDPKSLKVTNAIAITSVVIIYISCLVAFLLWCIHMAHIRRSRRVNRNESADSPCKRLSALAALPRLRSALPFAYNLVTMAVRPQVWLLWLRTHRQSDSHSRQKI